MQNLFLTKMNDFKEKCDEYFASGMAREYFSSYGLDAVMGDYLDAICRHSEGGKRIRAFLVYLGYCLYAGEKNAEKVFPAAISCELFQTGILAHDDIIDKSDYRRHKPSMHKDLGEGHAGVSKSICVGDMGIVSALEIITRCGFDEKVCVAALKHQSRVFASTIAGELKDIEFEKRDTVTENEILDMYRLKTAQYTVSGPLVLGAILAGADDSSLRILSSFGDAVGISFQIKDDILGIFGDEKSLGKSVTSDMCEGKKTVLTCHFENNADDDAKSELCVVYGKADSGKDELETVKRLFTHAHSLSYAEGKCAEYTDKARSYLEMLDVSEESRQLLLGLLEYMTTRNY